MIITALHFKRNNSSIFHSFKFTPGKATLRNTWLVSGSDTHPQWVLEAIKVLFAEGNNTSFEKILLEGSDDAGDTIVIEKDRNIRSIYLNGSPIKREQFLTSIFGEDIEFDTFLPENDVSSYKVFPISGRNQIVARSEEESIAIQKSLRSISRDILSTKKSINRLLRIPMASQSQTSFSLLSQICKSKEHFDLYLTEERSVKEQIEILKADEVAHEKLSSQSKLINSIEAAVQLIAELKEDASENEQKRRSMIDKISVLKGELQISPKEAIQNRKLYKKGFHILARMELLKKVVSILDEKRSAITSHIKTPFSDVTTLINKLLNADNFAFSELSEKLSFLETTLLARNISLERTNAKNQTWFEKFKKNEKEDSKPSENIIDVDIVSELKKISSDISVQLQGVRSSFSTSATSIDTIEDDFEVLYEAYIERLGEVKKQWQELSTQLKANQHETFTGFSEFYIKSMQLISYSIQKTGIDSVILSQKNAYKDIARKVIEWRKLNNSHNTGELDTAQKVLSEAASVLKYKESINNKLEKAIQSNAKTEYLKSRLKTISKQLRPHKESWEKAFIHAENRPQSPSDEILKDLNLKITLLSHFRDTKREIQAEGTVSPFISTGSIFSVWMLDSELESEKDCLSILECLKKEKSEESRFIGTEHAENAQFFQKMGCGRIVEIPGAVNIEALLKQLGIKKPIINEDELKAITAPHQNLKPTPTLAGKAAPTIDLALNENRVIKANKIQKTLDILNGNRKS